MDKDEAQFVLRSFRPDGADAHDAAFAEALQLAAADRELGEWLAQERASDAAFAAALAEVDLPSGLRDELLAGLQAENGTVPEMDEWDGAMIGALATIRAPQVFRDEILLAMERSGSRPQSRRSGWWFAAPIAVAAGIAAAFLVGQPGSTEVRPEVVAVSTIPISSIETVAIETLESPEFQLDLQDSEHQKLFQFISSRGRMSPEGSLPEKLKNVPSVGCRLLEISGVEGALVCFLREGEVVHLVVFPREEVRGPLPGPANPAIEQHGSWAVARWTDRGRAFVLLGHCDKSLLSATF